MLKELFEHNKDIVINSDIDGFLCGMILQKYYECRVVGFSDSHDTVWLTPDITDMDSPVYIDLFVSRRNTICIDQHIIAYDQQSHDQIVGYRTKMNPNLDRNRTFIGNKGMDYKFKYPFGTVHYLIYLMALEGITVTLPTLHQVFVLTNPRNGQKLPDVTPGLVITRADDALHTTLYAYVQNANDWWKWLNPGNKNVAITTITNYINGLVPANSFLYKRTIGDFFLQLGCDQQDGAFLNIADGNGHILDKVLIYRDVISQIMGYGLDIPAEYITHKGQYGCQPANQNYCHRALNGARVYSYAYIWGPWSKKANFSYTYDMV